MIHHSEAAPPPGIPPGYTGPCVLPGTGQLIFWTGRVAIGLRHQKPRRTEISRCALKLQQALAPSKVLA